MKQGLKTARTNDSSEVTRTGFPAPAFVQMPRGSWGTPTYSVVFETCKSSPCISFYWRFRARKRANAGKTFMKRA